MTAVARRYARAAVDAATEATGPSAVDEMLTRMRDLEAALADSEELRELLLNPVFKRQRSEVFEPVVDKLGVTGPAKGLLMLLADNDRINLLGEVADEIERLADEGAGRERAQVISAIEVTPEQKARISAALEKKLGRPVLVDVEVDASIRAGLICHVGDLTIDTSIKRQLDLIKETLTAGL